MKYRLLVVLFGLSIYTKAQQAGQWTDHLPYNDINDFAVKGSIYYCATNQGLFAYDASEKEITTYSKAKGLSDLGISAIAYNVANDVLIIGYTNANIDLLSGQQITNMGDIKRATSYTGKKRINHISTTGDVAFLATGFGIVRINLKSNIVEATYIIGPGGTELEVFQTALDAVNNRIYAATPNGLFSASLTDQLIFYQVWSKDAQLPGTFISGVAALNGKIFATKVSGNSPEDTVFFNDGTSWKYLPGQGINKKLELRVANNFLSIVNPFTVSFIAEDLSQKYNISNAYYETGTYQPQSAFMLPNGRTMLIGNLEYGLIICDNVTNNSRVIPNGPHSSNVYALAAEGKKMYVATGAIDELWTRQFYSYGYYQLDDFEWSWMPPSSINNYGDLVEVAIDPKDNTHVFMSSWGSGVLELKDSVLVNVWDYNTTNGVLQGPAVDIKSPRTGGLAFDGAGNLWVTSSQSDRPLAVKRTDGKWENFSAGSLGGGNVNVFQVIVNQLNQKWIRTRTDGILVMDDQDGFTQFKKVSSTVGSGNLPSNTVLSLAEDLDGEIWIGTSEGLCVLYSPQNVFRQGKNYDAQPILFEEDDVVQRLLGTEAISAIAIDGANKKWFGTQNSGVFYTTADGTETIYNFTADNSPLLSNNILDIAIDAETGEVYFATDQGIISFRGAATRGFDKFTEVYAYPNPVRPGYEGPIYIKGLVTNARVKITDVAGNIVYETIAEGGQARWDAQNLSGQKVVSGVYMAYITDDLAERTTITKILVIR